MEENNRNLPPVRRQNIDGVQTRRPVNPAAPVATLPNSQENQQVQQPATQEQPQNVAKKPKKRGNLLVITLAIFVLIGLSGLAVYAGLQQDKSSSQPDAQAQEASAAEPAVGTNELVDQTINEIDRLDDKSDASGEGLSDEKLGL